MLAASRYLQLGWEAALLILRQPVFPGWEAQGPGLKEKSAVGRAGCVVESMAQHGSWKHGMKGLTLKFHVWLSADFRALGKLHSFSAPWVPHACSGKFLTQFTQSMNSQLN